MAGDVKNYEDEARDAIENMRPNSKRTAHYVNYSGSPDKLLAGILKLPEVATARLNTHHFKRFSITIETK